MKLYFRGEEKGNLSYTTDGVRFTSTTLDTLKNGITLPDDTDYTKVQVKAGSNVFSTLDVVKKVELVQEGADFEYDVEALKNMIHPYLTKYEKEPNASGVSDYVYCVTTDINSLNFSYEYSSPENNYFSGGTHLGVLFQNKNTKRLEWQLDGAVDNFSDYEYVLVFSKENPNNFDYFSDSNYRNKDVFVLANLGQVGLYYEAIDQRPLIDPRPIF